MSKCSIEGCDKEARSKGWCSMHYTRWLRHGDPLVILRNQHKKPLRKDDSNKELCLSHPGEYVAFQSMFQRCYDPKNKSYGLYGARGIKICERWRESHGFRNFLEDMGPKPSSKHSLDRVNPDGNYSPENCRWATARQQAMNRRNTSKTPGVSRTPRGTFIATLYSEGKHYNKTFKSFAEAYAQRKKWETLHP